MQKIPTLFLRDPANMGRVTREVTPGCEWVLAGEGVATRKYDGTNVRVSVPNAPPYLAILEKRRNPSRDEKAAGAEPGYVWANRDDPSDQHIFAAADATDFSKWPAGRWSCEAIGPKIQGGVESSVPKLVGFSVPGFAEREDLHCGPANRSYEALSIILELAPWEGIVFHHPDGRLAKIKRRDLGYPWPIREGA